MINSERITEAKILHFFHRLKEASKHVGANSTEGIEAGYWMKEFKEWFDIKEASKGEL